MMLHVRKQTLGRKHATTAIGTTTFEDSVGAT